MTITVAHVMRTYGVHGGERQLGQLFRTNAGDRFRDIFLFVYRDDACRSYFESIPNLSLKALLPLKARLFPSLALEMLVLLMVLPVLQIRTIWMLRKFNAAVCVAHGLQGALTCWLAACLLRRVRFVYVHRGTKSKSGSNWIFQFLYRPYDAVAGVSHASALSLNPMLRERTAISLPNGIDPEAVQAEAKDCIRRVGETLRIISVGRLMPAKGQALIVKAFSIVVDMCGQDVELVLAGDGPDADRLRKLAAELNIFHNVRLAGYVSRVVCEMINSDIFVHASETEGLSNAVLEAMELGLPSVVIDAPGVTECHVDGQTGYVVDRDIQALAFRLITLIKDVELRKLMGGKAQQHVREEYSMTANLNRYHALYAKLLADI